MKKKEWEASLETTFSRFFKKTLSHTPRRKELTSLFIECFQKAPTKSVVANSINILGAFFDQSAEYQKKKFDFRDFLKSLALSSSDQEALLRALLYEIYYGDLSLADADDSGLLLLQILAENVSGVTLLKALKKMTLNQKLRLICFVHRHRREGTFFVLKAFDEPSLSPLIQGLQRRYFDERKCTQLLQDAPSITIKSLVQELENHARLEAREAFELFGKIIPLMIDSPVRVYEEMEALKRRAAPLVYKPNPIAQVHAQSQREDLRQRFLPFTQKPFSFEEFHEFVKIFGLAGHLPDLVLRGELKENTSLVEKMQILLEIFGDPLLLVGTHPDRARECFVLIMIMMLHMETMRHNPSKYLSGLQKMAVAIPTIGKELRHQPALHSVLEGFRSLQEWLPHKIRLQDYPVVVYDQSDAGLFKKNAANVREFQKRKGCKILHLSKRQILALAKKLDILPLIDTTGDGILGYGGSRNSCFLLTPVIRQAYLAGCRTVQAILKMKSVTLRELFDKHVLGDAQHHGDAILMIDDDMDIPSANFFSHAWFTDEHWSMYAASYGYSYGRSTKVVVFPKLSDILQTSWKTSLFAPWQNESGMSGMSEFLSKPRFCLNLPFGSEEGHLSGSFEYIPLLQPAAHDGGTRFPKNSIPTYPWVGLEERLKSFGPYAFHIWMVVNLLDPLDRKNKGVFPWNERNLPRQVSNLRELLTFVAEDTNTKEMQRRFWRNVKHFFKDKDPKWLRHISEVDTDRLRNEFSKKHSLTPTEKKSLDAIVAFFAKSQHDIQVMQAYAREVIKDKRINNQLDLVPPIDEARHKVEKKFKIKFRNLPYTQGLYLLFRAVGAGEFNLHIQSLLTRNF